MKKLFLVFIACTFFMACDKDDNPTNPEIAWDESSNGELSGDLSQPTQLEFQIGNNKIYGGSVPHSEMECTTFVGGPPEPVIAYMPQHESYTDVFSFVIPDNASLTSIIVESLSVTEVHSFEDYPCLGGGVDSQLGAFTGINNSNEIDWNSNSVLEFISFPVNHPLVGIGFAKSEGDDLLMKYKEPFPMTDFDINTSDLVIGSGNHTFWWKDGANQIDYTLNFIVTEN